MFDFTDKRVLVTGGARGIGAATVAAFLAQGARVAVGSRSHASYESFAAATDSTDICAAIGDVSDQSGARAVVDAAIRGLGGLDILVNSAGIFAEVAIDDITQEHWNATLATNLAGTFFSSQAALAALTASSGNIVNVASDAGLIGYPLGAAYSAAKGGVVNLTRAMAVELAARVRVNCVCPGNVETDMLLEAAEASGDPEGLLGALRASAPISNA